MFVEVCSDRNSKLKDGIIPTTLSDEEKHNMNEDDILEWYRTINIEFVDYKCKKKLSMHHMSDFQGNYKVEPLE